MVQRSAPDMYDGRKDIAARRIAAMHAVRLLLQLLSKQSVPSWEDLDGCRQANDAVRFASTGDPNRFAGFAVLPIALPDKAAHAIVRTVNRLKNRAFYDHIRYDVVFAMAEKPYVPTYLYT